MGEIIDRLLARRDLPRWVVLAGLVCSLAVAWVTEEQVSGPLEQRIALLEEKRDALAATESPEPVDYDGLPIDPRHAERMHADAQDARLPTDRITYWIDPRGIDQIRPPVRPDQVYRVFDEAWAAWSECLQIECVRVETEQEARVRHRWGRIDRRGGTLAWSTLPDGGPRPIEQRYDLNESWSLGGAAPGQIALVAVAAHEIGHALGLHHDAGGALALMRPTYSPSILGPTARDCERAVQLGYHRRADVPDPDGRPGSIDVPARLELADVVEALKGIGWELIPPEKK